MAAEFRPRKLLGQLTARGVDFVVIGGIALTIHGSDRNTFDLDICPSQDSDNLDVLGRALIELDARLRGIDEDVPFAPDGRSLKGIEMLCLDTSLGPITWKALEGSLNKSHLRTGENFAALVERETPR